MPIIVRDPRQNRHGWWGTFTNTDGQNITSPVARDMPLVTDKPGPLDVFLKTNWDSHFIAQGIVFDEVEFLSEDQEQAREKLKSINDAEGLELTGEMLTAIKEDLKVLGDRIARYHIIRAIDYKNSSALARVHSFTTEACFNNDYWLNTAGDIGKEHIFLARKLKRLPSKEEVFRRSAN